MSKSEDIKKDQIVPVRLSEAEKTFLREESDKMGIGLSTLIRMVVRDFIKEQKEKRRLEEGQEDGE
mgnify:CR=1 FL=1